MSLDENIKKLEDIANKLEDANLSMEDGVKLYEQGAELAKVCYDELTKVKGPICKAHGIGRVDGKVCVEADMTFAMT